MKQLPRLVLALFLFPSLLLTLNACCDGEGDRYYPIPPQLDACLPYGEGSTFAMRDSAGTTSTFSVSSYFHDWVWIEDCAECCNNDYGEVRALTFRADNSSMELHASLSTNEYNEVTQTTLYLGGGPQSEMRLDLDGQDCLYGTTCHDSLQISGQTYLDVFQVPNNWHDTSATIVKYVWYNFADGFLKYELWGGETWELVP